MTPEKVKLSDFLIEAPDKFVLLMNFIYGTDWLSYIRWRDGDHVADIISERLNIYYESIGGKEMNSEIELIKESDPEKVMAWDRFHNKDKRKTYRCHRCGAEWKCEYGANKFGTSHEYNGDPDILCQCCGFPTVKEVVMRGPGVAVKNGRELKRRKANDQNRTYPSNWLGSCNKGHAKSKELMGQERHLFL